MKRQRAFDKETGKPYGVIRPKKPALALAIAQVAVKHNDGKLLDRLPDEVGDYDFVGWLSMGPKPVLIDAEGNEVGKLVPGDSFVTFTDEEAEAKANEELKKARSK
jgi:hypothetical protein